MTFLANKREAEKEVNRDGIADMPIGQLSRYPNEQRDIALMYPAALNNEQSGEYRLLCFFNELCCKHHFTSAIYFAV